MTRNDNIRQEILLQLYGARPLARTVDFIVRESRKQGYDFTEKEVKGELQFLADENLVIWIKDAAGTGQLARIHANGVRYYEERYS